MARGIIASPAVITDDGKSITVQGIVSPEDMRYYALYWYKIVIPDSAVMSFFVPDQVALLETEVISRPLPAHEPRSWSGTQGPEWVLESQAQIAKELIESNDGTDWTIHQIGSAFAIPSKYEAKNRTVRVDLQNVLPVPSREMPIAEVLEFKERRRDELGTLHQYLDEIYLEILRAPDPALEKHAAVERLKASIKDLDKTAKERWKVSKKYDLSVELNLDGSKVLTAAAAASAFDFYTQAGLSLPITAIAGGLFSLLKVSAKKSMTFEPAKNNLKFGYLVNARAEGILPAARKAPLFQQSALREFRAGSDVFDFARAKLAELNKKRK